MTEKQDVTAGDDKIIADIEAAISHGCALEPGTKRPVSRRCAPERSLCGVNV